MNPIEIISQDLFDKIRSRFVNLEMGDDAGAITINPKDARFFDFDFVKEGVDLGRVSISINDAGSLKIYYSQGITENQDTIAKKLWYNFLKEMRFFARRRLLRFDTRDIAKTNLDKNDFQYLAAKGNKETAMNMNESRWNSKNTRKTSRAVRGRTEVIVRHHAPIDEMFPNSRSQRKNIKAIFIQNRDGERFKYPFIHTAGAFAMAQHVDHGGVPHDPAGKAIIKMSEQIAQLTEFQKKVRTATLHDDATGITDRAVGHLGKLKAQLEALGKRRHYENWIAEFNETENNDEDLMELDPVAMEDYRSKFTQSSFNEELASYFPLIHKIMQETNKIDLKKYVDETEEQDESQCDDDMDEGWKGELAGGVVGGIGGELAGTALGGPLGALVGGVAGGKVGSMIGDKLGGDPDDEEPKKPEEQFEEWAEDIEDRGVSSKINLTDDQIDRIRQELGKVSELDFGPNGENAIEFFASLGIKDKELSKQLENDAANALVAPDKFNALESFKLWCEKVQPGLITQLNLKDEPEAQGEPAAQPAPAQPAPAQQAPVQPAEEPSMPTGQEQPEQPTAENDEMGWTNGTMEAKKSKNMTKKIAEIVLSGYNASNPDPRCGPWPRGEEAILTDVEKTIKDKHGEKAGQHARQVAGMFMEKLTNKWMSKHESSMELESIKRLSGLVK